MIDPFAERSSRTYPAQRLAGDDYPGIAARRKQRGRHSGMRRRRWRWGAQDDGTLSPQAAYAALHATKPSSLNRAAGFIPFILHRRISHDATGIHHGHGFALSRLTAGPRREPGQA